MGAVIKNRAYSNRHRAETSDFLIGNVGEWQRLYFEIDFAIEIILSQADQVYLEEDKWVLSNGKNWSDYGFKIGDNCYRAMNLKLYDSDGGLVQNSNVNNSSTITDIVGDTLYMDSSNIQIPVINVPITELGVTTLPYNSQNLKINKASIYVIKKPESAIIKYSHITNSSAESGVLKSLVDGTETAFNVVGMNTAVAGVFSDIESIRYASGMSIKNAKYKYISSSGRYYTYGFQLDYCISAMYEGIDNFLEALIQPSYYFDNETITDNISVLASPEQNNPNLRIENDVSSTKQLGNVGWFNENFNGLDTDIYLVSVQYFDPDTLDVLEALSYTSEVRVKAVIAGVQNLSANNTKCSLGFAWVTDDEEFYTNKKTIHAENILLNTGGDFDSSLYLAKTSGTALDTSTKTGFTSYGNARMNVKDVVFYVEGSNLVYEATWSPTAELSTFFENIDEGQRNYILWISTSDYTLDTNSSDLTSLFIDYNQLVEIIEPAGEWGGLSMSFFAHPFDGSDDLTASDENHFVEDDILVKSYFSVNINTGAIPSGITFAVEAEKTDGQVFELDSYAVDLTQFSNDGNGIPQYDIDQIRGFKSGAGNNKNWVKVQRYSDNDSAPSYGYVSYFGLKIRWEDWIKRANVPADFFDNTELNNGFNNDWYHYLTTEGWGVNVVMYIQAQLNGEIVQYKNKKAITFVDYESNAIVDTEFIYKRNSDLQLLEKTILSGENTRIEVVHTLNDGSTWGAVEDSYGTICLEPANGAGQFAFRQISTIWESENDNPLLSLLGNGLCNITLISPTQIKLEAVIDPSKLEDSAQYKITSRIGAILGDACNNNVLSQAQEDIYSQAGDCIIYV